MLFIGYSNKDRYNVVESILFHLKNYGFSIWYDFYDMLVGDNREKENFEKGIKKNKYCIFVISENFFKSKCAVEELDYARELYENELITLFLLFYNYDANLLPNEYNWMKKIIYSEITSHSGTLFVTNQIIEKILADKIKKVKFRSVSEISKELKHSNSFLHNLFETYLDMDISNYSARIAFLYSSYLYLLCHKKRSKLDFCHKIISKIYKLTSLNISIDHLSLKLFEQCVILLMNDII